MMALAEIQHLQHEVALRAAEQKKLPFMVTIEDIAAYKATGDLEGLRIPSLGDYLPAAWYRVDLTERDHQHGLDRQMNAWFVDKSGFGVQGELALTLKEFSNMLEPNHGYAVVEEGQFQVLVGVFKRTTKPANRLTL